jgi:hypothetical protein
MGGVEWIVAAHDMDKWRTILNAAMNFRVA